MAMYLIGDVQGCDSALAQLIQRIDFSPSRDTLYLLGDLVNRGPASAAVLRRLMGYGSSAQCVLGNHDLHLLAVHYGIRKPARQDTLSDVLDANDAPALLHWLRQQKLALHTSLGKKQLLMVHAGVLPAWTATKTIALAAEVEAALQSPDVHSFLQQMYGNGPHNWSESLHGPERLRVIVNALTRLRFCTPDGQMEFAHTGARSEAPAGYVPWFDAPQRQTAGDVLAFGHWSALGWLGRKDVYALDSGCVWGGCLTALQITPHTDGQDWDTRRVQAQCSAAQQPHI